MTASTLELRRDQMFPVMEPNEIERLRRFGTVSSYAEGESLFRAGEIGLGMFVILKGEVVVTRKDALAAHRRGGCGRIPG
jgi:thioredoxin reductase (NADPH)